jgi:hypothetical protein
MIDAGREQSCLRARLHRFHVLMNPLLWIAGGARAQHRSEFLSAADLATKELSDDVSKVPDEHEPPGR